MMGGQCLAGKRGRSHARRKRSFEVRFAPVKTPPANQDLAVLRRASSLKTNGVDASNGEPYASTGDATFRKPPLTADSSYPRKAKPNRDGCDIHEASDTSPDGREGLAILFGFSLSLLNYLHV